jgi:hypothetical protein
MTIHDAEHYSEEDRAAIIAGYPAHERDARSKGIPVLGSGRVFPIDEEKIKVPAFSIPNHFAQIIGVDFGWDHPFAAVHLAWDKDSDCVYVCNGYREKQATPVIHAASIKPWGDWVPIAWPHDGYQHDKGSGQGLKAQYKAQGLNMLEDHATHADGGFGTEAGVMDMFDRMQTGRWKVFDHLNEWFSEFRLYHRKDGKIEKVADDLMSASRIANMMLRCSQVKQTVSWGKPDVKWVV